MYALETENNNLDDENKFGSSLPILLVGFQSHGFQKKCDFSTHLVMGVQSCSRAMGFEWGQSQ